MKQYPAVRRLANLFAAIAVIGVALVILGAALAIWGHEEHVASDTIFLAGFGGWLIFMGVYLHGYSKKVISRRIEASTTRSEHSHLSKDGN